MSTRARASEAQPALTAASGSSAAASQFEGAMADTRSKAQAADLMHGLIRIRK
jgi:hypothetical protein